MHRPVVIQHHSLAFFDDCSAPARSPAASLLLTCEANTIATTPGIVPTTQHRHSEAMVIRIAHTM